MAHLHELLAVDRDLENTAKKVVEEAVVTFTKKTDHFTGGIKTYEFFDEKRQQEAPGLEEKKELTTTVKAKLDYVKEFLVRHLDALAQKEHTNKAAESSVFLNDGELLLHAQPGTLLLSLESRLEKLRPLLEAIPTLQPGVEWVEAPEIGQAVWKTKEPTVRHKTEKKVGYKVLYEATKEHPAQIEKWTEDVIIGQAVSHHWSGMITPAQKSTLLKRLDEVVFAIKKARMRANEEEVKSVFIGDVITNYIFEGKI